MTYKQYIADQAAAEERARASYEARMAAHHNRIAALKARKAEVDQKIVALEKKLGITDWLCYLPRSAGSKDFMARACAYLENFRARIEAAGAKVWLCLDHDFVTNVFEISEFRAFDGNIFCSGQWTDQKYRQIYKGVSPDNAVFAGDIDLLSEKKTPPCMTMDDLPAHTRAAASSPKILGLGGACCVNLDPGYGRSPIYRFTRDKITSRERLEPVKGVLNSQSFPQN
jgi:hypothetical protein